MPLRQYESIESAAERLAVNPRTIRRAIADGRITGYRIGTKTIPGDALAGHHVDPVDLLEVGTGCGQQPVAPPRRRATQNADRRAGRGAGAARPDHVPARRETGLA
jgi:excisionase family DNA binding protein